MSQFTGPLVIKEVIPGRRWQLVEPIRYEAVAEGSGIVIEVPAGFETDGATIPAALRVVLAVWGTYGRAACVHDFLYGLIRAGDQRGLWETMPCINAPCASTARRWADAEFRTAMRACGTRPTLAWLIWASVSLFGARYCKPR
jgi:hypothetical protein